MNVTCFNEMKTNKEWNKFHLLHYMIFVCLITCKNWEILRKMLVIIKHQYSRTEERILRVYMNFRFEHLLRKSSRYCSIIFFFMFLNILEYQHIFIFVTEKRKCNLRTFVAIDRCLVLFGAWQFRAKAVHSTYRV